MNMKMYVITIIVSIILMIPYGLDNSCGWFNLLSGIGCSGVAAALMSIFLDRINEKREQERKDRFINGYFYPLYNELSLFLGRLLWIDEHINDDEIICDLPLEYYYSKHFMIKYNPKSQSCKRLDFQEAEAQIQSLEDKYSTLNMKDMPLEELDRIRRLFLILHSGSLNLVSEVEKLKNNAILLDSEGYFSLDEINQLCFNISLGIGLLDKERPNYEVAISSIFQAYTSIRTLVKLYDSLKVTWSFSTSIVQL